MDVLMQVVEVRGTRLAAASPFCKRPVWSSETFLLLQNNVDNVLKAQTFLGGFVHGLM